MPNTFLKQIVSYQNNDSQFLLIKLAGQTDKIQPDKLSREFSDSQKVNWTELKLQVERASFYHTAT